METLFGSLNTIMYFLVFLLCFLQVLTAKKSIIDKKEYDIELYSCMILVGIFMGFTTCGLINYPQLIPPQKEWPYLIFITIVIAGCSVIGAIIIVLTILSAFLALIHKIGEISIVGGWFLLLSLKYADFMFILIFIITILIGLMFGWSTKKLLRRKEVAPS